jgi:hypothetical protein
MIQNKFIRFNSYQNYLDAKNAEEFTEDSIVFVGGDMPLIHTNSTDYFGNVSAELVSDQSVFSKVSTPNISFEVTSFIANVTITCSTIGATIYYTLDGSDPVVGDPHTQIYDSHTQLQIPIQS